MRRFTILSLMGLVLVLALAIAALRNANDYWAGGLLLAAPMLLCIALVGASCGQRRSRDRRLGFAVFGWAYFALAFLDPGQIVATPGALEALKEAGQGPGEFLSRHLRGDWGDLCEEDRRLNDLALRDGSRILSAYTTTTVGRLWIITEAEDDDGRRAATTILLVEDY
jgi:hypothetical protein